MESFQHPPRPVRAGFALLELLLVVALLMLFASAAVLSLAPLWRNAPLEEGVSRFEGLLRFARAEAAQHGRRVRLQVSPATSSPATPGAPETPAVQVQWEPEPLRQPGVFVPTETTTALAQALGELVRVESVRRLDPDAQEPPPNSSESDTSGGSGERSGTDLDADPALANAGPGSDTAGDLLPAPPESEPTGVVLWPPITFYPDGSSDSAEILLAVVDPSDTRRMLLRWNGTSGTTERVATRSDAAPGSDGLAAGEAHPLEPSSVARSAMGHPGP